MKKYDVIVIGAGVAGMTSAIYLKRFGFNVLILEKEAPGGQINKASLVENYPGFKSIDGPTLAYNIYEQVLNLNIEYKYGNVVDIKNNLNSKQVITDKESYECKAVVIASGRTPKKLGIANEQELLGKGISYCAICDGSFFKNEDVCIVGGGNSAIEESLFLSKICKSVTILNRSSQLKADKRLVDLMEKQENIKILYNSVVDTLNEKNKILDSIKITCDNMPMTLNTKGLFIYIGSKPDTSFLKNLNIKRNNDYIMTDSEMQTSIEGIFACGDVIQKNLYQLTTAIGDASIAANSVKKYLNK